MKNFKLRIRTSTGWITEITVAARTSYDAKMIAEGQYGPGCVLGYL